MKTKNFPAIELDFAPTPAEVFGINREQIIKFKDAYWAHTDVKREEIRDVMSEDFISVLAADALYAKEGLRNMMRHSQYWNESLQAWAIPLVHKHTPNPAKIESIVLDIWQLFGKYYNFTTSVRNDLNEAAKFFAAPDGQENAESIEAIINLAPRVYHEGKKKTKIFRELSKSLGLWDEQKGSYCQKYWAQLGDEWTVKDLKYTLYVSINPAHFLSMSNPKGDSRGESLTSCHSFNGEHCYKSGAIGYAIDDVTMLAFTAANSDDALLNRKTSRQVFCYHKGALLQSRLYTSRNDRSYGGIRSREVGEYWEYKEFRVAIQNEISRCENGSRYWRTTDYRTKNGKLNKFGVCVNKHSDFGGYEDWEVFSREKGMIRISVRKDMLDEIEDFTAGEASLSLRTGEPIHNYEEITA